MSVDACGYGRGQRHLQALWLMCCTFILAMRNCGQETSLGRLASLETLVAAAA